MPKRIQSRAKIDIGISIEAGASLTSCLSEGNLERKIECTILTNDASVRALPNIAARSQSGQRPVEAVAVSVEPISITP